MLAAELSRGATSVAATLPRQIRRSMLIAGSLTLALTISCRNTQAAGGGVIQAGAFCPVHAFSAGIAKALIKIAVET
jgi:hypothetical protein